MKDTHGSLPLSERELSCHRAASVHCKIKALTVIYMHIYGKFSWHTVESQ